MNLCYFDLSGVRDYPAHVLLATLEHPPSTPLRLPAGLSLRQAANITTHLLRFFEVYPDFKLDSTPLSALPLHVFRCLQLWFKASQTLQIAQQWEAIEADYQAQVGFAIAKENQDKNPQTKPLKTKARERIEGLGWQAWATEQGYRPSPVYQLHHHLD